MNVQEGTGYLQKSLSPGSDAVVICVSAPKLIQEIIERQSGFQNAESLLNLGKSALAAALIQGLNEQDVSEQIFMQWHLDASLGNIYTDSLSHGVVRATMTHPKQGSSVHSGGNTEENPGIFQLRRVRGELKYNGIINSFGNINEDIQEYFLQSEQKYCAVGLSLQFGIEEQEDGSERLIVTSALGYLVHILPETDESKKELLLKKWHEQLYALGGLSNWALSLDDSEACREMTQLLCFSDRYKIIFNYPVKFECTCSEEKVRLAVQLSDEAMAQQNLAPQDEGDFIEVKCHYCGKTYLVPKATA